MRIFRADISEAADRERVGVIRLVVAEGRNFPELGDILNRHGSEFSRAALADWLGRQAAQGRIRLCDAGEAAQMLMDMVFGVLAVKGMADLQWPVAAQRKAHIRNCIDVFLNGVCPHGKPAAEGRAAGRIR